MSEDIMDYSYYMKTPFYEFIQQLNVAGTTDAWGIEGAAKGSLQAIVTDYVAPIAVTAEVSNDGINWVAYDPDNNTLSFTDNGNGMIFINNKVQYIRGKYTGTGKVKFIYIGGI